MRSVENYISNLDRRLFLWLGRSWTWRMSRFVIGVVPPIGALIGLLHCSMLLGNYRFPMTEWLYDCSLLGTVSWFITSFAFGFCWIHRAFISYGVLVSLCIDYQRTFGFGSLLFPARLFMVLLGLFLFAMFFYRKAWQEFYKRQK